MEILDQLLPGVDIELVNVLTRNLQKMNAKIHVKSKVKSASVSEDGVEVTFETPDGKESRRKWIMSWFLLAENPTRRSSALKKWE